MYTILLEAHSPDGDRIIEVGEMTVEALPEFVLIGDPIDDDDPSSRLVECVSAIEDSVQDLVMVFTRRHVLDGTALYVLTRIVEFDDIDDEF